MRITVARASFPDSSTNLRWSLWAFSAQDAHHLLFDLSIREVEQWLAVHGPADEISTASEQEQELQVERLPEADKASASPRAVKREPSNVPAPKEWHLDSTQPHSTSTQTDTQAAGRLTQRVVLENVFLSLSPTEIYNLVGGAAAGVVNIAPSEVVSYAQDEGKAVIEMQSVEAAVALAKRMDDSPVRDRTAKQRRTLRAYVEREVLEPPQPRVLPTPNAETSPQDAVISTEPPPSPRPNGTAGRSGGGSIPEADGPAAFEDLQISQAPPKRLRSSSPLPPRDRSRSLSPRANRRSSSSTRGAHSPPTTRQADVSRSPTTSRAHSSVAEATPKPPNRLHWIHLANVPPAVGERRIAQDLREIAKIRAYNIFCHPIPSAPHAPSRVATVGVEVDADAKRVLEHFKTFPLMHQYSRASLYRNPRTGERTPRWVPRDRYVEHEYNLTHPPFPAHRHLLVRGMHPNMGGPQAIRAILSPQRWDAVVRIEVDPSPTFFSSVAQVEAEDFDGAVGIMDELDGVRDDRGYAITVVWDGGRKPPPSPSVLPVRAPIRTVSGPHAFPQPVPPAPLPPALSSSSSSGPLAARFSPRAPPPDAQPPLPAQPPPRPLSARLTSLPSPPLPAPAAAPPPLASRLAGPASPTRPLADRFGQPTSVPQRSLSGRIASPTSQSLSARVATPDGRPDLSARVQSPDGRPNLSARVASPDGRPNLSARVASPHSLPLASPHTLPPAPPPMQQQQQQANASLAERLSNRPPQQRFGQSSLDHRELECGDC